VRARALFLTRSIPDIGTSNVASLRLVHSQNIAPFDAPAADPWTPDSTDVGYRGVLHYKFNVVRAAVSLE
jgi:hypothetical protein